MTESTSQPNTHSRRGNDRTSDTHEEDGLKLTCCGCMDIRRGVILTLWVQFVMVLLVAIALLVLLVVLTQFLNSNDQSARSTADSDGQVEDVRVSMWVLFGIYLALTAFTCGGLVIVKYRNLKAYKAFVVLNIVVLCSELILSIVLLSFQVWTIVGLVLRAYWVWVFYRYIATLAMEIAHIERQKELEVELYR